MDAAVRAMFLLASLAFLASAIVHIQNHHPGTPPYYVGTIIRVPAVATLLFAAALHVAADRVSRREVDGVARSALDYPAAWFQLAAMLLWLGGAIGLAAARAEAVVTAGCLWFIGSVTLTVNCALLVYIELVCVTSTTARRGNSKPLSILSTRGALRPPSRALVADAHADAARPREAAHRRRN